MCGVGERKRDREEEKNDPQSTIISYIWLRNHFEKLIFKLRLKRCVMFGDKGLLELGVSESIFNCWIFLSKQFVCVYKKTKICELKLNIIIRLYRIDFRSWEKG